MPRSIYSLNRRICKCICKSSSMVNRGYIFESDWLLCFMTQQLSTYHVFNTSSDFQENSAVLNFTFWAVLKLMIHLKLHILRSFRPSRICIFQYVVFLVVRQSTHRSRSISISLCMITPECALGCFFLVKVGASAVWC